MGADLSRVRLNSLLDFAGVELKQGGLLLDADANESMAIVDRRLRALASDVLGRATVSSTTPNAFKLALTAAGALEIAKGRLYVDGLLAENHGATSDDPNPRQFDDLLAEPVFAGAVPYDAQPYLPEPPDPPETGRHLVYLDVWNREVTHLENPDLVESAVGVETASRIQTVWQVRMLDEEVGDGTDCASPDADFAGWSDLIAPSSGVLTTGTYEVAPVDDPCELPATGGYRGLENQLYRVEIHDPGQPGAGATFKWSRENASVGSTVASVISASEIELASLGRDDVLRFNSGDWVEITNDVREFSHAAGEIRRITVNEATRRLTFTPALPANMLPPSSDPQSPRARDLRVRRWDHKGRVFRRGAGGNPVQIQDLDAPGSSGVINVPAAGIEVLLENGVTVRFDSTGTTGFRPGDYWVFAARTTDASVEILDRAPPKGTHHHYARLAIWDVSAGTLNDCRHPWPPAGERGECGCSACVTAESHASGQLTIQDAVNQVAQTGGTVCLGPGTYALREPVRVVNGRSVRIRGQGPNSVIVAPAGGFSLEGCMAVAIENLSLLSLGGSLGIHAQNVLGLSLRQLVVALVGTRDQQSGAAIAFSGIVAAASVRENAILAPIAIAAVTERGAAHGLTTAAAPARFLLTAALAIDDNYLWCQRQALTFTGTVLHLLNTRFTGNEVVGTRDPAVSVLGLGAPASSLFICGNSMTVTGDGIRCGVDGAWIERNKIANVATGAAARSSTTVGIALAAGLDANGSDQCQILANQVSGFREAGIRIGTPTRSLLVKLNVIENCGNGIISTDDANGGSLSIENNQLRNIGPDVDDGASSVIGIGVRRAVTATIAGNVIRSLGTQAQRAALRAGIFTVGVARARVLANEVSDVGPPSDFLGATAGIMIRAPFTQFEVSDNHVRRDAGVSSEVSRSPWHALMIADVEPRVPVDRAGLFTTVSLAENRTVVLGGGMPFLTTMVLTEAPTAEAPADAPPAGGEAADRTPAARARAPRAATEAIVATDAVFAAAIPELARGSVHGNTLMARGAAPAVVIASRGECLFNGNRVELRLNTTHAAVTIATTIGIVSANRVRGGEVSIRLTGTKQAAVLGNITSGPILVPNALQEPWLSLNLRG